MNLQQRDAGRELDALVAERVMGRKVMSVVDGIWRNGWQPNASVTLLVEKGKLNEALPEYSTDISAAFQVVEAMKAKGWHFQLHVLQDRTTAFFYPSEGTWGSGTGWGGSVTGEPAFAICAAAIKSLDVATPQSAVPTQG